MVKNSYFIVLVLVLNITITSGQNVVQIGRCLKCPQPLYLIDGIISDSVAVSKLISNTIINMTFFNFEEVNEIYGEDAKYGLLTIWTKRKYIKLYIKKHPKLKSKLNWKL